MILSSNGSRFTFHNAPIQSAQVPFILLLLSPNVNIISAFHAVEMEGKFAGANLLFLIPC